MLMIREVMVLSGILWYDGGGIYLDSKVHAKLTPCLEHVFSLSLATFIESTAGLRLIRLKVMRDGVIAFGRFIMFHFHVPVIIGAGFGGHVIWVLTTRIKKEPILILASVPWMNCKIPHRFELRWWWKGWLVISDWSTTSLKVKS